MRFIKVKILQFKLLITLYKIARIRAKISLCIDGSKGHLEQQRVDLRFKRDMLADRLEMVDR